MSSFGWVAWCTISLPCNCCTSTHSVVGHSVMANQFFCLMFRRAEGLHEKQVLLERRLALVRAGISQALRTLGTSLIPPSRPEDPASVYSALLQVTCGCLHPCLICSLSILHMGMRVTMQLLLKLAARRALPSQRTSFGIRVSPARLLLAILICSQHSHVMFSGISAT